MKSFSVRMLVTLGLLAALPAQAQIYKCKDAAGRVTLQQTRCPGVGAMVATPAETAPRERITPQGASGPNPDARYLTSQIAAALAERDYQRAESLAVTAEHRSMINEAKRFNPSICKFRSFVLGDKLGKTLAATAKEECLSTKGQLGPAYVRWRDHYQTESARRSGIAAAANAANAANQPKRGMTCRPDYLGGMDCTPQ